MDYGIGGVNQAVIIVCGEGKVRRGEITAKNPHASLKMLVKLRKIQVQLQTLPQSESRILLIAGTDQQIQRSAVLLQQIGGDVCADVSSGTGQENRHVAPFVPVLMISPFSGTASKWRLREGRASRGRPSIRG